MNTKNISNNRNLFVASLNAVPACQMQDGDTDWFPAVDVTEAGQAVRVRSGPARSQTGGNTGACR